MPAITPLQWSSGLTPASFCIQTGAAGVRIIAYGSETTFECLGSNGASVGVHYTTVSCDTDAYADFSRLVCAPRDDFSAFDSGAAGAVFGLAFASTFFCYLIAFGAGTVLRAVRRL